MRILYLTENNTVHDRRFLTGLVGAGCETLSLSLQPGTESTPLPDGVVRLQWPEAVSAIRTPADLDNRVEPLRRILADVRPDVLHAGPAHWGGGLAALADFHPTLVMSWGSDVLLGAKDERLRPLLQRALRHADAFFCDALAVRREAEALEPQRGRPVVQFPWGVDLDTFAPLEGPSYLREQLGWQDAFVLLSTRSWEPLYGIDVLLEAFKTAGERLPRLRLMLLGDGSEATKIRSWIERSGLSERIAVTGNVSGKILAEYFRACDLYVSASRSDGTSVSLLEALATGKPALVSDIPSNREWVDPGANGWLAKVDDVAAFAERMALAAGQSEDQRRSMAQRNRALAEQRADWRKNLPQLIECYRQLVARST